MESEIEEKLAQEARTEWQLTSRIFEWVWKRGVSGKSAIALVIFAIYAPLRPNIIQWYFRKRRRRPLKETPA